MTAKQFIGSTTDSAYMAITEVMGLTADAMDQNPSDALLVITLSGKSENAIVGGTLNSEKITRLQSLLDDLKLRAASEGDGDKVLHAWR
jgi:regulator of RNase E activity RraA